MSSFLKKASKKVSKVAKSLGGSSSSSKRKATSTPSVSTTPSISNYEPNYPEGYDQELHDYAEEVEREIRIEDEEEEEEEEEDEEPTTPIGILRSRQSSIRSLEAQQQQRQARSKRVNFHSIDENEPVRQPFPAMPPPSGRAISHVWSYFTQEPTDNPDVFLCTCQICESQGVKPLVSYNFSKGGGTGSFNKHLAKKHGITKETHAASDSGTTSGSRQQWATDFPGGGMSFKYNRNEMIDEFSKYVICDELPFNHGESWDLAIGVQKLLEAYVHATKIFSYVYEPNVHLVISECITVFYHLLRHSYDDTNVFLKPILADMMDKWKAYFTDFPYIYGIATILDPCFRTENLSKIIGFYYQSLDRPSSNVHIYVGTCKKLLTDLYDHYSSIYNPSRDTSRRASVSERPMYYNPIIANIISQDDTFIGSSSSSPSASYLELDNYLKHHFEIDQSSYNILQWWKEKSLKFPILSRIAKDILAIPASTIASESAFSAGRRVLDEKRSRLAPHTIQICVCKKDWDQADVRTQGLKIDDDQDDDDPWMMMDTSASSSGGESAEASNQPYDDDD